MIRRIINGRLFLIGALIVILCAGRAAAFKAGTFGAPSHQYPWSEWLTLNDGRSNGLQFSFRKGDNNFIERGMIFIRVYNRYKDDVYGNISFVIDNNGRWSTIQTMPLAMKPEMLDEDPGSWYMAPGNNESAQAWGNAEVSLRDIRVTNLRLGIH